MKRSYIVANFGGPRSLAEISPFLQALLTDRDVIRSKLPPFLNTLLFRRVAKKRAKVVVHDYQKIGGKSPIFDDTEALATRLRKKWDGPVFTFHRYLCATHQDFVQNISTLDCDEIVVFPLFPQFTYATTGSIARWFERHLPKNTVAKMRWVKSYPTHPGFITSYQELIREAFEKTNTREEDACLLFSAHGIPQSYVDRGDLYEKECTASFHALKKAFPKAKALLSYQSQFGPEEWLRPYTSDVCEEINQDVFFVPLTFTSDHIETLFEIEMLYVAAVAKRGLKATRVPALNMRESWIEAIPKIVEDAELMGNQMLVRRI